jgi:hypothetical protein
MPMLTGGSTCENSDGVADGYSMSEPVRITSALIVEVSTSASGPAFAEPCKLEPWLRNQRFSWRELQ